MYWKSLEKRRAIADGEWCKFPKSVKNYPRHKVAGIIAQLRVASGGQQNLARHENGKIGIGIQYLPFPHSTKNITQTVDASLEEEKTLRHNPAHFWESTIRR